MYWRPYLLIDNHSRSIDDADLWPVMYVIDGIYKLEVSYVRYKEIFELFVN